MSGDVGQSAENDGVGYLRDASWWNHPDVRKPKRVHRLGVGGFSACSPHHILLNTDDPIDLRGLGSALCKRCFPSASTPEEGRS